MSPPSRASSTSEIIDDTDVDVQHDGVDVASGFIDLNGGGSNVSIEPDGGRPAGDTIDSRSAMSAMGHMSDLTALSATACSVGPGDGGSRGRGDRRRSATLEPERRPHPRDISSELRRAQAYAIADAPADEVVRLDVDAAPESRLARLVRRVEVRGPLQAHLLRRALLEGEELVLRRDVLRQPPGNTGFPSGCASTSAPARLKVLWPEMNPGKRRGHEVSALVGDPVDGANPPHARAWWVRSPGSPSQSRTAIWPDVERRETRDAARARCSPS